jgi:hypothetical protein
MSSNLSLSSLVSGVRAANNHGGRSGCLIMKIERFAGQREARQAVLLSIAGVTAIMLIANLFLTILR